MEDQNNNINFNTACDRFKQKIIDDINLSNIPIAPIYYIMSMVYQEVEKAYYAALNEEALSETPRQQEQDEAISEE